MMKILNWNVNGLRAIMNKGVLLEFIEKEDPDIMAFEETKMQPEQLPHSFDGYHIYINSAVRKGYSGVMVITKKEPLNVIYDIKGEDEPLEGRVITLEYSDFYFVAAYVPNSKDGFLRLGYRMKWEDLMRAHLMSLDQNKPVIYTGDLNVAHEEIDLKNPDKNHLNAGFSDEERAKFSELLRAGFSDTYRKLYPERVQYSWWSYRALARSKGIGWRIDYFVVSNRLLDKVSDSIIYDQVLGSDHCPIGLLIDLQ